MQQQQKCIKKYSPFRIPFRALAVIISGTPTSSAPEIRAGTPAALWEMSTFLSFDLTFAARAVKGQTTDTSFCTSTCKWWRCTGNVYNVSSCIWLKLQLLMTTTSSYHHHHHLIFNVSFTETNPATSIRWSNNNMKPIHVSPSVPDVTDPYTGKMRRLAPQNADYTAHHILP